MTNLGRLWTVRIIAVVGIMIAMIVGDVVKDCVPEPGKVAGASVSTR